MTAHSQIGASSMHRWAACPGSVRLSAGIVSKSSKYAEEGSDAHALGALCLKEQSAPGFYIGEDLDEDGRQFTVTDEMAEAVQVYVQHVESLTLGGKNTFMVEHKFDLTSVYPGCFGTADCVVWDAKEKMLHVVDYKHGAGIPVDVADNPQLQYYGLGALITAGFPAKKIKLTIVQPRCDHPGGPVRSWDIDAIDLLDFRADLIQFAKATEDPNALLAPGDHCRFCPAAALCPALEERSQALAKVEFTATVPYDPAKLKLALDSLPEIEARVKAVREFAYAEAEAGRAVPGYKLVAKRATRKWRDEGAVIDKLQKEIGDDLFEPRKLKTPAQMEKLVAKAEIAQFTVAESSGHTLVPETDKRPAVKLDAKSEFEAAVVIPPNTPLETGKTEDLLHIPDFLKRDKPPVNIFED